MKKLAMILSAGMLIFCLVGCNNSKDDKDNQSSAQQSSESSSANSEPSSVEEESTEDVNEEITGTVANGYDYANGWTEEMAAIKTAVTDSLGENYWPNTPLMPDMLEMSFGLTEDMYEDYMAEMPMISTNVDTLVIVKAKEGMLNTVEEALNAYRDAKVNDSMQYPMNIGKVQASRIERIGNYVCFVQLGADTTEALDKGDEAVIEQCQKANEHVIEIIGQQTQE